jgi:hypothetical protein
VSVDFIGIPYEGLRFFYAWQSDRLERLNRHLIRFALNLAAKNISDDPAVGVRVTIDADTEGVLGHVPVTDTILKKIADCDAFVSDLTFGLSFALRLSASPRKVKSRRHSRAAADRVRKLIVYESLPSPGSKS